MTDAHERPLGDDVLEAVNDALVALHDDTTAAARDVPAPS